MPCTAARLVDLLQDLPSWRWLFWFDGHTDACLRHLTVNGLGLGDINFMYQGKDYTLADLFNGVDHLGEPVFNSYNKCCPA